MVETQNPRSARKSAAAKASPAGKVSTQSKGKTIFAQGDPATSIFCIDKGTIKLLVHSRQGKEAVVGFLGSGDFFGQDCLAGQERRITTVTAMTDCQVMRWSKSAMIELLNNDPKFRDRFVAYLLTRNLRIKEDLIDQLFNSSEKRLARLLLRLTEFGKDGRPEPVIADISQETLADMIGTTRSRVNFFMNKFRKSGFIDYDSRLDGHLRVHGSLLNVILRD